MRDGFSRLLLEEEEIPVDNQEVMQTVEPEAGDVEPTQNIVSVDISTFGTDNSGVQNEFDPKEVERLNILIASENSAIGEYFTAAKETNVDVLRRLYSDIGEEERFHSEQLIFAKSQITGETYVPRDPDVKAEYEKLLDMGVDEETAMATAVDKVGLMSKEHTVSPEEEIQQMEDLTKDMETLEYTMYQEYLIFNIVTSPAVRTLYERDNAVKNFCEAYLDTTITMTPQVFVEAVVDSSSLPASKQKVLPDLLGAIIKLIKGAIKAIKNMGSKFTQFWVNMRETRKHYSSWLKNHSIKELFSKGFSLYLWDDNKMDFDFDDPVAFITLLYNITLRIAAQFNISVNKPATKFNIASNKTVGGGSIENDLQIIKNAKFIPTKIVLNESNEKTILNKIFGYDPDNKFGTENNDASGSKKSWNGYNGFEALAADCNAYLEVANKVLEEIQKQQGQQGGATQSNPEKFNTAIKQMKDVANAYTKWINILNHDMTSVMKINNELAALIRNATANDDYYDSIEPKNVSTDQLPQMRDNLTKKIAQVEQQKAAEKDATKAAALDKTLTILQDKLSIINQRIAKEIPEAANNTAGAETPPSTNDNNGETPSQPEAPAAPAQPANSGGNANTGTPSMDTLTVSQSGQQQGGAAQKKPEQTNGNAPISEQLKSIGIEESLNESDGKRLMDCFNEAKSTGNTDSLLKFYIAVLKKHYSTKPNRG